MSRYTSLSTERTPAGDVKTPKFCEVTECKTLWVPHPGEKKPNGTQAGHYARGQAVTIAVDHFGIKRGICADHYLQGLVAAGKAPNNDLRDSDGRYDREKVITHWATMDQRPPPAPALPPAPTVTKGMAHVLDSLDLTAHDSEPDWLWEHP